ncbi:response regulator transcription factor [Candidatus Gottesmanbacteria bacterium]|nr:response regulator transcription factor [Candidatus Gottesmanbacteria bacterium]
MTNENVWSGVNLRGVVLALLGITVAVVLVFLVMTLTTASATPSGGPQVIMVIDDSFIVLDAMTRFLPIYLPGVQILTHNNCESALTGPSVKVDLIILDNDMPGNMDGPVCLPLLRAKFPSAKIVGQSVDADAEIAFKKAGADGFFPKSGSLKELVKFINNLF